MNLPALPAFADPCLRMLHARVQGLQLAAILVTPRRTASVGGGCGWKHHER